MRHLATEVVRARSLDEAGLLLYQTAQFAHDAILAVNPQEMFTLTSTTLTAGAVFNLPTEQAGAGLIAINKALIFADISGGEVYVYDICFQAL